MTLNALGLDLKYAIRSLRSEPRLSCLIVIILAAGVAAFTLASAIVADVLAPSVLGNTDRLGFVFGVDTRTRSDRGLLSLPEFLDIRARASSFDILAARTRINVVLTGHGQAARLGALRMTANHFPLWQLQLARGRPFDSRDEAVGAPPVTILTYGLWQDKFGRDETIVGRPISLDGESVEVIGVLDSRYPTGALADLWLPLQIDVSRAGPRDNRTLSVVGLLKPGVDVRTAHQEVHTIALQFQREHQSTNAHLDARVVDMRTGRTGPQTYYNLGLLGVSAVFVLVTACVNVGLLLLARAAVQQNEMLVRLAVGAPRSRIIAQEACKGLVLAIPSALGGLGITALVKALLVSVGSSFATLAIDWRAFRTAALVSLLLPLIFTVIPALSAGMRSSFTPLVGRGMDGDRGSRRRQRRLVELQVGLAVMLLVVAGLVVRSFFATLTADFGVDQRNLLNVSLTLPSWKFKQPEEFSRFFTACIDRVAVVAGVSSVAAASSVPGLQGAGPARVVRFDSPESAGTSDNHSAQIIVVSRRTFETLGVPLIAGRDFSSHDTATAARVVLINKKLAGAMSPHYVDLVGRRLTLRGENEWREIVGIVADTRNVDFESFAPLVFVPHSQEPQRTMTLLARMPRQVLPELVTAAVFETDSDVAPYLIRSYRDAVSGRVFGMLVLFGLFAGMAATAALLAGVGLYGAFSFAVTARMREFGVRQALGATTQQIRRLVYEEGWKTVVSGILIGMLGGAALSKYAVGVLYAVSPDPLDPTTYAACAVFVVLVCAVALVIPGRRASRAGESLADLLR